jgi:hypothetical protein
VEAGVTPLPYVDEHAREIEASCDRVWAALVRTLSHAFRRVPDRVATVWGLDPRGRSGSWESSVHVGDTVPGFEVAEVVAARLLVLRGGHRFSQYELGFELDGPATSRTRLRAKTNAAFPGLSGTAYRAVVIGTGGHRIAVRRLLAQVAARAERPSPV